MSQIGRSARPVAGMVIGSAMCHARAVWMKTALCPSRQHRVPAQTLRAVVGMLGHGLSAIALVVPEFRSDQPHVLARPRVHHQAPVSLNLAIEPRAVPGLCPLGEFAAVSVVQASAFVQWLVHPVWMPIALTKSLPRSKPASMQVDALGPLPNGPSAARPAATATALEQSSARPEAQRIAVEPAPRVGRHAAMSPIACGMQVHGQCVRLVVARPLGTVV